MARSGSRILHSSTNFPFNYLMTKTKTNLDTYRAKRNFDKTPEPEPIVKQGDRHGYLIQKHAASHLHYDFRLELDGVLKSWAVPKGPSLDPHDKRLAMQVEDHPVEYGSFEGIIPQGEYGGGTVMLWDRGTWEPVGDPRRGLAKGKLVFQLHGERLRGEWTLVKTFSKDKRGNSWLLIKHKDNQVREGDNAQFLQDYETSVVSGRSMEEIAGDSDKVWKSHRAHTTPKVPVQKPPPAAKAVSPHAGKVSKMPGFTPPQLATLSSTMPKGPEWVHELKFDGYRMISHIHKGHVEIFSRNGKDWTATLPPIAALLGQLTLDSAILDGELVVRDGEGKSNFMALNSALSNGEVDRFQYYVFDVLYLNGRDTTRLPLLERKALLADVLATHVPEAQAPRLLLSEHFTATDDSFLHNVCSLQLEGVVSKRADAPYRGGRSKLWLKTKCQKRQELVIGGFVLPSNGALGVGALLLGYYDGGRLHYAGRVGTGFTQASSKHLRKLLDQLRQKQSPYVSISTDGKRGAIWVKPQLVCEVEFTEWTPDGSLRHPSFKGLREDKPALSIVKEVAISPDAAAPDIKQELGKEPAISETEQATPLRAQKSSASRRRAPKSHVSDLKKAVVGGITISHPQRVIYPGTQITKLELAEYYLSVSDNIMPHIAERPLSMVRCPDGAGEPCFFQRHVGLGKSPHLHEIRVGVKGTGRDYLMIRDVEGLISLVQWGVIELHPWQCGANNVEKPDRMIFDLDPDPSVSFHQLIEAAHEVRQRMRDLGLVTFLKTTGGKGLHVVVPMTPRYSFPAIKAFARAIAESMAADSPTKYIATMSKAKRAGKIFIDYLRNDVTSTAVAPYSARARDGAPVSTPIAWEELTAKLQLSSFTIDSVPQRLQEQNKDPWVDFNKTKQKIAANYLKALNIEPQ
jgi:bifunctional non-homologous end joining protein LigD